jgi:hypothetical protein
MMTKTRRHVVALTVVLGLGLGVGAHAAPALITTCGTITTSGSYKLANNLAAAGNCLILDASNVTIDLDGFTISGDGTTGSGITTFGVVEGLSVRNGTIRLFDSGINVFGNNMLIERMTLLRNVSHGLRAVEDILLKDSIVSGNGVGVEVGEGAVVTGNVMSFNTSDGLRTAVAGASPGGTFVGNTLLRNGGAGLRVECPSAIIGNTANGNAGGNVVRVGHGCSPIGPSHNVAPLP